MKLPLLFSSPITSHPNSKLVNKNAKVALVASMQPSCFEKKLVRILLEKEFEIVLPLKKEEDEYFLKKDLSPVDLEKIHVFNCDFSNEEESQLFQTYLFETWYPLDAIFVNFYQHNQELKINDLTNKNLEDLFSQGIVPSFNFCKCILPLVHEKDSKVLVFSVSHQEEYRSQDFGNRMVRSCREILLDSIKKERQEIGPPIDNVEILIGKKWAEKKEKLEESATFSTIFEKVENYILTGEIETNLLLC